MAWRGLRVPPIMKTNNRGAFCFDKSNNFYIKAGPRGQKGGNGATRHIGSLRKRFEIQIIEMKFFVLGFDSCAAIIVVAIALSICPLAV